ncbi:hypothetical protein C8R44DRAFT_800057 [Mycena epipterygia]|nr:hypothetical protein C8R44DRAFT_800057 [Mycena epipterygia]
MPGRPCAHTSPSSCRFFLLAILLLALEILHIAYVFREFGSSVTVILCSVTPSSSRFKWPSSLQVPSQVPGGVPNLLQSAQSNFGPRDDCHAIVQYSVYVAFLARVPRPHLSLPMWPLWWSLRLAVDAIGSLRGKNSGV